MDHRQGARQVTLARLDCAAPPACRPSRETFVANHKSALKRIRQNEKRRARNRRVRTGMRSVIKAFRAAADSGDVETARDTFAAAERGLRRAASKGIVPRAHANRRVSRLAKRLNALSPSP